jgi:hypothetical protein
MFLSLITLAVALSLSAIAAYYSIAGLAAIFAAAVIPIIIMGSVLELAKVVVTLWLHEYWSRCRLLMKLYLLSAVCMLMLITSMGIFGFLSKAHSDQSLISGDAQSKIAIYDEKIKTARENIEADRRQLRQMDEAVDQVMARSTTEQGATKSNAMRRAQARDRADLAKSIETNQKLIGVLNEQAAPIRAEVRKIEAEVGPIKYIAAMIYGDNPDANLLERSVRWVIILLVFVFDPLAIMMLLSATESLKWAREKPMKKINEEIPEHEHKTPDANTIATSTPAGRPPVDIQQYQGSDPELDPCYKCGTPLIHAPGIGPFCPNQACDLAHGPFLNNQEPIPIKVIQPTAPVDDDQDETDNLELKHAKEQWKADNPNDTLKRHRRLLEVGVIDQLPWMKYLPKVPESGFGTVLPEQGSKGDTFVSTNGIPHRLYKHNGSAWISIDNTQQDNYTYDTAYIDHLIKQIEQGLYDPDQLSDSERDQIEQRIIQTK